MLWWLILLVIPAAWLYCNWWYKKVWGYPLKWWAIWASHGALLFVIRIKKWEKR